MHYFKLFVNSTLLLTTPSLFVYPQNISPRVMVETQTKEKSIEQLSPYDKILHLLDQIESGELEKTCTVEELNRVKYLLAFLAKKGALPDNSPESLSLDEDIDELLRDDDSLDEYTFSSGAALEYQYMIVPALCNDRYEVLLCKNWLEKKCSQVKKFYKKHKKAILIGGTIAVGIAGGILIAAALAPAAGAAITGAVGAAGAAASSHSGASDPKPESPTSAILEDLTPWMVATQEAPSLASAMDHQVSVLKDHIVGEQFFQPPSGNNYNQQLPWQENARALGSIFGHDSISNLQDQIANHPALALEAQHLQSKYNFPIQGSNQGIVGHSEIDRIYSTDYSHFYANPGQTNDFNALSYQVRGEKALEYGYYNQAVQDFGKAIDANPTNPIPYLERGVAHFGMGQYDRSIEDYHRFASEVQKSNPLSVPEFSLGFAKSLPQGIYDSGSGLFFLVSDLVTHPINTGKQMWDALSLLSTLVRSEEWATLSEALVPEIHQLVKEWDSLTSEQKGKLAGYAFGKHGADILIPGAVAKCVTKGICKTSYARIEGQRTYS